MPRAALLSLHARVAGVEPVDVGAFLARPAVGPSVQHLRRPEARLRALLAREAPGERQGPRSGRAHGGAGARLPRRQADDRPRGRGRLGVGNAIRYAAPTGTLAIRWEGARAPTVWTVPAPKIAPAAAQRELARRYLHVFGPTTADSFARWAGISARSAAETFASLEGVLLPVRSPLGDEWLLAEDEPEMRSAESRRRARAPAAERGCLLPARRSGARAARSAQGSAGAALDVACLARRAARRRRDPRHLEAGGAHRRIETWARLSRGARDAVEAEAATLAASGPRPPDRSGLGNRPLSPGRRRPIRSRACVGFCSTATPTARRRSGTRSRCRSATPSSSPRSRARRTS